jgi:hypothetical protein
MHERQRDNVEDQDATHVKTRPDGGSGFREVADDSDDEPEIPRGNDNVSQTDNLSFMDRADLFDDRRRDAVAVPDHSTVMAEVDRRFGTFAEIV